MARIEDYALIGDMQSAGLVSRDGAIDWLCLPRFDSPACFASLLGTADHGSWRIAPAGAIRTVRRRYRGPTLVLETEYATAGGRVRVLDCMPPRREDPDVVRLVEGLEGEVEMHMLLTIRFDYGSIVPWVRTLEGGVLKAVAGPDSIYLWTPVEVHGIGFTSQSDFSVRAGDRVPFVLLWHPSQLPPPQPVVAEREIESTEHWWLEWSSRCGYRGPWSAQVLRSAITLKALTLAPTGGIIAAATTSLPEQPRGVRNWDYRFCWIRDATFTLYALLTCGYVDEAKAWRDWLLRAVAGDPSTLQIMYGASGERRLPEQELPWLPGYEGSSPVRIGNAAYAQFQLDVYGELMDALHLARRSGLQADADAWRLQHALLEFLESGWSRPDEGIWEVRGPRRDFTHSKIMAWVAFDRAVKAVERFGCEGPVERWRSHRDRIHRDVCARGYDATRNTFTQYYGSSKPDAALLMMPLVGFLPCQDRRIAGTVAAIERELTVDGFVRRYDTLEEVDGLPRGEGVFLPCTFWLADNYVLQGRREEGLRLFERLLAVANDVGLLAEEYDPGTGRLLGNFPQAMTHVSLINTASNLARAHGPAEDREHV